MAHPLGDGSERAKRSNFRRTASAAFTKLPPTAQRSVLHAFGRYAPWEEGFDFTPPRAEHGEVVADPDFVGIGTQKAGTTWWYEAISEHPDVYSRPDLHKERHYFDRFATKMFGPDESEAYRAWFPRPSGMLSGEWTPDYMNMPWVPQLMSRAAPNTKLLVILRDPVDRIASGLAHHRRATGAGTPVYYTDLVTRGFYHDALSWWHRCYPPEQILLLQYERCLLDPVGQLTRTYGFLGLDPFVPETLEKRINPSSDVPKLDGEAQNRLVELYTPDVHALCRRFDEIDLGLWRNFRKT